MILVIGGAASGKQEYVHALGYGEDQIADAALGATRADSRPVLINLHELVFADPSAAPALLDTLLTKELVTCDEVGAGVIPGVQTEREAREATGRLCNQLAQHADKVVRLVAGIPQIIKG
jgi:adenosyl cobinamide kinase/adenosyl cobinamide phosphate guanylyltransferase